MPPSECQASPAAGDGDRYLLFSRDESEGMRGEGDAARKTAEIFVGFAPDRRAQCSNRFFSGSRRCPARDSRDAPLRSVGHGGCSKFSGVLPSASWGCDSGPGRRPACLGKAQRTLVFVIGGEFVDDDIALQLGVGVDDAHGENRRSLIEEPLGRESRGGHGEHTTGCLDPHTIVGDLVRATEERQHVLRGIGV